MRVVFDSNVFISAFVIPGSQGERAFLLARHKRFVLHTSVAILTETAAILRRKFGQDEGDIKQALRQISRAALVSRSTSKVRVVDDEADNRILECALDSQADLVVTGDRHLLRLKRFEGIPIVRLADFLRSFPKEAADALRAQRSRRQTTPRTAPFRLVTVKGGGCDPASTWRS